MYLCHLLKFMAGNFTVVITSAIHKRLISGKSKRCVSLKFYLKIGIFYQDMIEDVFGLLLAFLSLISNIGGLLKTHFINSYSFEDYKVKPSPL